MALSKEIREIQNRFTEFMRLTHKNIEELYDRLDKIEVRLASVSDERIASILRSYDFANVDRLNKLEAKLYSMSDEIFLQRKEYNDTLKSQIDRLKELLIPLTKDSTFKPSPTLKREQAKKTLYFR